MLKQIKSLDDWICERHKLTKKQKLLMSLDDIIEHKEIYDDDYYENQIKILDEELKDYFEELRLNKELHEYFMIPDWDYWGVQKTEYKKIRTKPQKLKLKPKLKQKKPKLKPKPKKKSYNTEILDLLQDRMKLGLERYGHGVQIHDDTRQWGTKENSWGEMALEEVLDGLIYTAAAILRYREKGLTTQKIKYAKQKLLNFLSK